jgi:multidrug resistance efflux pump
VSNVTIDSEAKQSKLDRLENALIMAHQRVDTARHEIELLRLSVERNREIARQAVICAMLAVGIMAVAALMSVAT